jgi:hypothetical protein
MIQYISTKLLRSYVGLSEETFLRINHNFYHIYRRKFNEVPIQKLITPTSCDLVQIFGRTLVREYGYKVAFILREVIFESIFEVKLTYLHSELGKEWIYDEMVPAHRLDSGWIIYETMTEYISYLCEISGECMLYIKSTIGELDKENTLTIILDMREGQNVLYIRINNTLIRSAISNIPHEKKQLNIWIEGAERITLNSLTHLSCLPTDLSQNFIYHDSNTGKNKIVNKNY